MKYFEDTDTVLLEFGASAPVETRELSEDIHLDLDKAGHVVSITVEHASSRSDFSGVTFQTVEVRNAPIAIHE